MNTETYTEIYQGSGEDEKVLRARLRGRWIHVLRCLPPNEVAPVSMDELVMADVSDAKKACMWFELLSVSDQCKYFTSEDVGDLIVLPAVAIGKKQWCRPLGNGELMVREAYFDDEAEEAAGFPIERPPLAVFVMEQS